MKIDSSIEWNNCRDSLKASIQALPYNKELRMMLKNIDSMVDELSKVEVNSRRKRSSEAEAQLNKVNSAIATLEQWIMMASFLN